jgi:hypothetical protein
MQTFFRTWSEADARLFAPGMTSVVAHEKLCALQAELGGPRLDDDALRARLDANFAWLERFAASWRGVAVESAGDAIGRLVPVAADLAPVQIDTLRLKPLRVRQPV